MKRRITYHIPQNRMGLRALCSVKYIRKINTVYSHLLVKSK